MQDHIFREYDIRGVVGQELFVDQMYDLVKAIAVLFKRYHPTVHTVAVGMDGRIHSQALKDEAVRALVDSGLDVLFLGVCPTPVLYFSQHTMPVDAGIMITASHNPAEYNGIKFCLNKASVFGAQLIELRDLYKKKASLSPQQKGTVTGINGVDHYVAYLVDHFAHLRDMDLGVVIDCANAVGGLVFPQLIKALGWSRVHLLYPELDGTYPNHEADPVVEKNMVAVKELLAQREDLEVGIGLDGDCDRMAAMTKSGYLIPGDKMLMLFSKQLLEEYPGAAIVFDIRSSTALIEALTFWGARPCISACGHAIIKHEMKKQGALLAGELSCHFCFGDRYFGYDDGIYAALRLFELLVRTRQTIDELVSWFPNTYSSPEIRFPCAEERKKEVVESVKKFFAAQKDTQMITIDGVRATMPYGWGLVRASNTQAMLSVRFESDSVENLNRVKQDFVGVLSPFFDKDFLEQHING